MGAHQAELGTFVTRDRVDIDFGYLAGIPSYLRTQGFRWTALLDAVRLGPGDDETEVTAAQVRDVVARLARQGTGPGTSRTSRSSSTPGMT